MKNFIKRITDRILRKPLLVKPVVSHSICECGKEGKMTTLIDKWQENVYVNRSQILCVDCLNKYANQGFILTQ